MQQTLILNIEGRPTPYAMQVPENIYRKFAHYERNRHCHPDLIERVEAACRVHVKRTQILMQQISDWKQKTEREIELFERKEIAQTVAKNIFI